MAVLYIHLTYEEYKALEQQMKTFAETAHKSTGGFYHKSIRLTVSRDTIMEFHGPLVGGYGHLGAEDPYDDSFPFGARGNEGKP